MHQTKEGSHIYVTKVKLFCNTYSTLNSRLLSIFFIGLADKFSRKYSLAVSGLVLVVGSAIFSSAFCVW